MVSFRYSLGGQSGKQRVLVPIVHEVSGNAFLDLLDGDEIRFSKVVRNARSTSSRSRNLDCGRKLKKVEADWESFVAPDRYNMWDGSV